MNVKEIDRSYIAGTYSRFPLEIAGGAGSIVWDGDGREYIDMASGIAVNALGVSDPEWVRAVTAQLNAVQHTSNLFYSEPCALLAQALCQRTGMKKVFFANSGAEANECAIKAARKYREDKHGAPGTILTLCNSFHGRTLAALAATGQDHYHRSFLPMPQGFVYAPANDVEALCKLVEQVPSISAFMFELVQGEGGVIPLSREFVDCMVRLAAERDILLICDEVQTGNGRTGSLYAWMQYGFVPDIMSTAKGLGGGLPLGACLFGEKTERVLSPGDHGSTFGGNPVCCAGGLSVLSRIDDALLAGVRAKGEYVFSALSSAPGVEEVSGLGLMIGIKTKKDPDAVIDRCRENGVLVIKAHDRVRLLPALNIPMELLERAVAVIAEACKEERA